MDLDWAARPELARGVVAGWLVGIVVGLICLGIVMAGLVREPAWATRMPRLRVGLPIVGIIAANGILFVSTIFGVLLGLAYGALPGVAFSVAVLAVAVLGGGLYWIIRSGARGSEPMMVWSSLVVATLGFAVALPVLAETL